MSKKVKIYGAGQYLNVSSCPFSDLMCMTDAFCNILYNI